jgi:hypothetical protein
MRVRFSSLIALSIGILLSLVLALSLGAADKPKKAKAEKLSSVAGRAQMINKDTSTITVENKNIRRQVLFSGDTKFLYGHSKKNKPGMADQVKEGNYISCAGKFNEKTQLVASTCVYREQK